MLVAGPVTSPFPTSMLMSFECHAIRAVIAAWLACMQAIEFVQMQRDDELWELLISLALESPALTGALFFFCLLPLLPCSACVLVCHN